MSGIATILIGQAVRAGREEDFVKWQHEVTAKASQFPGYLSSELNAPTAQQSDWTVIYRFDSVSNARCWLDSAAHQDLLDQAAPLFAGPGTRQIISDRNDVGRTLVTLVGTSRVPPDKVDEFLAWEARVAEARRQFAGFRGVEVFRPVEGVQDDWTICLKFDTAENLDAWLTSDERHRLNRLYPFGDFTLRRIDHSFGNWFSLGNEPAKPPSNLKTTIAVWMGLYPTVMFLTMVTMPLNLPMWANLLVGNLLSGLILSYVVMPYYTNPILHWWLRPKPTDPQPRTDLLGIALVLAINAAWVLFFIFLTDRIMH
jgi:antibiotic biosynthesis monooxygenase (ABM) superfamily enzyme